MKKRFVGGALAVTFLGATLAAAQVTPPSTPYYPPSTPYYPPAVSPYPQYPVTTTDTTAKNPLLLAMVLQPVLQQGGAALAAGVGALFNKLFAALLGHGSGSPTAPQPGVPGAYGMPPGAASYPGAPAPYGAPGTYPAPYGATTPTYPTATSPYGAPATPSYPGTSAPYGTPGSYGSTPGYPTTPYGSTPTYPSTAATPSAPTYGAPAYPNPTGAAYPATPNTGATTAMAGLPTPVPGTATTMPVGKSVVMPSVVFSLIQLDAHSYATVNRIDLTHGAPALRTGDVFAIEYAANVSGQVRIDNIDSRGQRTALGTYTVLAGHDNRIPRTKGIQLTGTTGTETFKLYFFPCVPPGADAKAQNLSASLPACPDSPNPQLLQASKGVLLAKGAVNLESPDPTIAVSAAQDYQPNDITESDFQINHTEGP